MDHASHLVGTALAGEIALTVALGLARLLLLDGGHLLLLLLLKAFRLELVALLLLLVSRWYLAKLKINNT